MRLYVTGISGFVGSHLARVALARGDSVAGACLGGGPELPAELPPAEVEAIDVLDTAALARAIRRFEPDAVVHLAALSHVGRSWSAVADYFRVNVLGTESLLAAARDVPRVLVASSAEVYGVVPEEEQPIAEERTVAPASPYALTKAAAERTALAAGAVVVRSFNLVGAGQATTFALPSFARQLAEIEAGDREPVIAVGNLSARRDFLHVEDGALGYLALAERGAPSEVYNLAAGRALSIEGMLDRLLAVAGVEARVETDPERLRPVDQPLLLGDAGRLRELGWAPEHDIDQALDELWQRARCEVAT